MCFPTFIKFIKLKIDYFIIKEKKMYPHFGQTPPSTPHLSAEHDGYIIFLDPTRLMMVVH